jgi:hypothetical protein
LENLPKGYIDEQGRRIGLFLDLPEAEYHTVKAFSYSFAKAFGKSPAHGQAYLNKKWEIDPDREKFKAVHLLCLEPELHARIEVRDGTWRDKLKEEVQNLQRSGKIVLKSKDLEEAKKIAAKVKAHSIAGPVISNALCEVSIFWIEDGVYCKARIDILWITPAGIVLADLKNFGDLSSEGLIGYQIGDKRYFWQMAFYARAIEMVFGEKPLKMHWFFVEDSEPHGVKVRNCTEAQYEAGWLAMGSLLPKYRECLEEDVWPCYEEEDQDAGMPDMYFGVIGTGVSNG